MRLKLLKFKPVFAALLSLLVVHLITAYVAVLTKEGNQRTIEQRVQEKAEAITDEVVKRIELYQYGLRGARGAVVAGGDLLSRELFLRYSASRDPAIEFPGARGFGFIRRIPQAEEADFIRSARADGYPDFQLRQLSPHDGERFIIQYIEPVDRNREAVGLDIASEKNRREAAMDALLSGEVRLTGPITLVQATGNPFQSFLILMPIYHGVVVPATIEQRKNLCYGWSYAPLLMQEVLSDLKFDQNYFHLTLLDVTSDEIQPIVFDSGAWDENNDRLFHRTTRWVYGRDWQFMVSASPAFVASLNLQRETAVYAAGDVIGILVAIVILGWSFGRQLKQQAVIQRELLVSMVSSSPDAIVTCDNDGRVTSWNQGAERLFGMTPDEVKGKPIRELIVPADLQEEEKSVIKQVMDSEPVAHFTSQRCRSDGRRIDVSIAVAPIINHGKVEGYSKTIRDITDEVMAQQQMLELNQNLETLVKLRTKELEISRRTLQGVLDSTPSLIAYWDKNLRNVIMNKSYLERFGIMQGEATGKYFRDVVGEAYYAPLEASINKVMTTGSPLLFEHALITEAEETVYFLVHLVPDLADGKVQGLYTLVQDITETRENLQRVESLARENEALLSTINQQMLYSVTDRAGKILDVNANFIQVTGYSRDELVGNTHHLVNSGVHPRTFWRDMWRQISSGHSWHGEVCNRAKDGSLRWFDTVIAPFTGSDGVINRYVALRMDITEKRAVEAEKKKINRLLADVLNAASEVSIIATDTDGMITIFNTGAEKMLGYSSSDMVGKCSPAIFHLEQEVVERGLELSAEYGEDISGFDVFVYRARNQKSETRPWTYVRQDGLNLRVSLAVTAMRDEQGVITGYLGVATDITEQEYRRRELHRAKELADSASAAKSAFLANMSHEIRTPMNAVLGMLQLIANTGLDSKQRDYVGKASRAAKSLLEMLNEILDFSKIEAGKLSLETHPFSLAGLVQDLGVVLSGNLAMKPVELLFDIDPRLPCELKGDALRLRQVLINLGGNALKFTSNGMVVVKMELLEKLGGEVRLKISVEDTGIGISAEQQHHIFEGFTQAEASTSRRFGGTGLGLAISKHLVEMMGGKLQVDSEVGKGSCFWFELLLPVEDDQPLAQSDPARVLVVAEDPKVAEIVASIIDRMGCRSEVAASGAAVIEKLAVVNHLEDTYDVLLVDESLSDVSSQHLAESVAEFNRKNNHARVIVLADTGSSEELLQNCSCIVLNKPVTPNQLSDAITVAVKGEVLQENSSAEKVGRRLQGLRLLVVEDNELNREVAAELLKDEGAIVELAEGGQVGIDKVFNATESYDLVIMDMQMPDIDGLEATRRIRSDQRFNALPILAMTANASSADRAACLEAGMNEHVGKPIDMMELVPAILALTGQPEDREQEATPPVDSASLIEAEEVLKRFNGNVKLIKRVQPSFYPEVSKLLEQLDAAIAEDDRSAARAVMHTIKGTAGTVGALALSAFAAELEAPLREEDGPSLQQVLTPRQLSRLQQMFTDSDRQLAAIVAQLVAE